MAKGLKIKPEHYAALEQAIARIVERHPTIAADYEKAGLSDMRLNWDLLNACSVNGVSGMVFVCKELYPYLDDANISRALAAIGGNSGLDSRGRK